MGDSLPLVSETKPLPPPAFGLSRKIKNFKTDHLYRLESRPLCGTFNIGRFFI